jgi:hypothetical protein
MTEQQRHLPTPPDRAAAVPTVPYDRTRWESAVLARRLHHIDTLVAFVLSHHAGPGGVLAEDGIQRTDRMNSVAGLSPDSTRLALKNLQKAGLLTRPASDGKPTAVARPVTLTVPARRWEPRHTGERP